MYVRLPKFIEPDESYVYRLVKPLYGLSDAGRQFYLKLKKILSENGYVPTLGDSCFWRKYGKDGGLQGFLVCHVDDLAVNGHKEFVDETVALLKKELTISKVVKDEFRFCGLDLKQLPGRIELSMEEYVRSMFIAPIPAKTKKNAKLTGKQQTMIRAIVGALSWVSMNVRLDLSYGTHELSKRLSDPTIKDLQFANYMVKKAKERQNKMVYRNLGKPEDLRVIGFSDASFNTDKRSTGGQVILLGNKRNEDVSPIMWKTKLIRKVCRSSKDAELLSLGTVADHAIHLGKQLEEILFNVKNGNRYRRYW